MIKILVLSCDNVGKGYYRINSPYLTLKDPDITIDFTVQGNFSNVLTDNNIANYDIIVYQGIIPIHQQFLSEFYNLVRKNQIKLVFDVDDYWVLHHTHNSYNLYKNRGLSNLIEEQIKNADYITTTTSLFADVIKNTNPNVVVLENAINTNEQQWHSNKIESDKTRFLWGGSITHLIDLKLLSDSINAVDKKNVQLYMCGYDNRAILGNKLIKSDMSSNPWTAMESVFTNSGKNISGEYKKWLSCGDDNGKLNYGFNEKFKSEFYQRRWSKPILTYGTMYNEADVALAPIKNQHFNFVKSQIKILEAGIHKCPIIASDYGSYTLDVVNGKNGFLIDENDKMGWYNKMKYFTENPNAVKEMGEALYETVISYYTLEKINKKRIEFLKSIV